MVTELVHIHSFQLVLRTGGAGLKILLLGDRFITNEVWKKTFQARFAQVDIPFEFVEHQLQWPVVPMESNDEVSEFSGSDDEIIPLLQGVEVMLTHTGCITKKVLDAASDLKVIALGRGGPVNVNNQACSDRKIPVLYAPGRNSGAVAEFTVALICAQSRNIAQSHYFLRHQKTWRGDFYANEFVGHELSRCTIGLVGFGAIGRKVAAIMTGFGTKVMAFDPFISDAVKSQYPDYRFVDFETLLKESDIISLHTKYTPENAGMIGKKEIALMKDGAIFINTARPQLVDYDALYDALAQRKLSGAGLDVFEDEPPQATSKLFSLDNVTATPHLGGASKEAAEIGAEIACDQVYQYLIEKKSPQFWFNKF